MFSRTLFFMKRSEIDGRANLVREMRTSFPCKRKTNPIAKGKGAIGNMVFPRKKGVNTLKKLFVAALSVLMLVSVAFTSLADTKRTNGTVSASMSKGIENVTDKFADKFQDDVRANDYDEYAVSNSGPKNVIVELEGDSIAESYNALTGVNGYASVADFASSFAGERIADDIKNVQKDFLARLKRDKIGYTHKFGYAGIMNGVALTVDAGDIDAISKMRGVKNVIYSETYYTPAADPVFNEVNAYSTGIYNTTGVSYTGAGMVVAILDTGLDYTHNAFKRMPQSPSMNKADVERALESGSLAAASLMEGVTADQLYMNEKVPYQFDYADSDADVFPVTSSHGTHVAGIIGGYEEVVDYEILGSDDNMYFDTDENGNKTFSGVAVDSQLAIFKVFSDLGETGAPTEALLAALNDAVLLDVDIINMSLGSAAGYSRSTDETAINEVYDRIRTAGITLAVAAGNESSSGTGGTYGTNLTSNPDSSTIGSPSTYNGAISVASISGQLSPYLLVNGSVAAYFSNGRNAAGKDYDFLKLLLDGSEKKTFKYVVVGGYGESHNYTTAIQNKLRTGEYIAVVQRGNNSFEEKQRIAAAYGAVGCIIYNNVSGIINASLGTGFKIPTCTITMDIAKLFIDKQEGTIEISEDYKAGPFMSDFSSWGASPDLQLYPDITAHGGFITSAVLGGYGVYSGTSMATPNIAGITTLIRQHLVEKYPDKSKVEINDMLYQTLMSTATIAMNEEGNPYSPRKQGAGLADILNTLNSDAYLYVEGSNKTKLELGDDPEKRGTYALRFHIKNTSNAERRYNFSSYVMTEKVSSDGITVAEKAYMLGNASVAITACESGATYSGNTISVAPGADAKITVKVSLTAADKAYLDANFANGMFVEGFLTFTDVSANNRVNLNIPFMGFYGDWLAAPMFDLSKYDVSGSKYDDSVPDEDKLQADVYETVVLGRYFRDSVEHYMPLGQYIYNTADEGDGGVESSIDKIAVGNSDYGVYGLYSVYAGLLRGPKSMKVVITDSLTGEVVFTKDNYEVRKSVGARPGFIDIDIEPYAMGMKNNSRYNVSLTGAIDYANGEKVSRNSWDFSFYVDYETPTISDYGIRTVYDSKRNKTVYLDLELYDNHYVQALQLFVPLGSGQNTSIDYVTEFPTPVYSNFGDITKVTLDITQYIEAFTSNDSKEYANRIGLRLSDYALNSGIFLLPIVWDDLAEASIVDNDGKELNSYDGGVTLGVNQAMNFTINVGPEKADHEAVVYECSMPGIVDIKDDVIFGKKAGTTKVTVKTKRLYEVSEDVSEPKTLYEFTVNVADDGKTYDRALRTVSFASYTSANGANMTITDNVMSVECGLITQLTLDFNPWYAENTDWYSSKTGKGFIHIESMTPDIVSVTETGGMTTLNQGVGRVKVSWEFNNVMFESMLTVIVGEKYTINSGYMTRYRGADTFLEIPANLGAMYLSYYGDNTDGPFANDPYVKVAIVPSGVTSIGYRTFYGCENLETIYLPATLEGIGYGAFRDCKKLKNIYWYTDSYYNTDVGHYTFTDENGNTVRSFDADGNYVGGLTNADGIVAKTADELKKCTAKNLYLWDYAFADCTALAEFDLSKTTALYSHAFEGCTALTEVDITNVHNAGESVFDKCTALTKVTTGSETVIGMTMFQRCSSLVSVDIYAKSIGVGAFFNCPKLERVTVHNSLASIGEQAFARCTALKEVNFGRNVTVGEIGYRAFYKNALTSISLTGTKSIDDNAFEECASLVTASLDGVESLGAYAFLACTALNEVTFGSETTLASVGASPFYGCNRLTKFSVASRHPSLMTKYARGANGTDYYLLYSKDEKTLLLAPPSYQPAGYNFEGLTTIGASAYANSAIVQDTLTIPEGITHIGDFAFGFNQFRTLVLPASLVSIDANAFYGCRNLSRVVFLGNNITTLADQTFANCTSLESISLPYGITSIGAGVFYGCTSLESITVPASVESLGTAAFGGCSSLKNVTFEKGSQLRALGTNAFAATGIAQITLPKKLVTLGDAAFMSCANLTNITIPASVRNWGSFVFNGCSSLSAVTVENGVPYIGAYAFAFVDLQQGSISYNTALKSIDLPASVTMVGPYAFAGCNALTSIALDYVEVIDEAAFLGCAALADLGNTEAVYYVGAQAFSQCVALTAVDMPNVVLLYPAAFSGCTALAEVKMAKVQMIGSSAFNGCKVLASVSLPEVRALFGMTFFNCAALTEISLPKAESFGQGEFSGSGLTSFHIPATLTDMDVATFFACLNLTEITVDEANEVFFTDGVAVYRKLSNGNLQAEAYPAGRTEKNYTVLDGTVRINDYAFGYAVNLFSITLPASLKNVGAYAFYYTGAASPESVVYTFNSLQAPTLEAELDTSEDETSGSALDLYANFTYLFGRVQTSIRYPANGKGYTNFMYANYFAINEILPDAAEETTLSVIDMIEKLVKETATAEQVQNIRTIIDNLSETQRKLVSNYSKFVEIESAVNGAVAPTQTPKAGMPTYAAVLIAVFATLAVCGAGFALFVWFTRKKEL